MVARESKMSCLKVWMKQTMPVVVNVEVTVMLLILSYFILSSGLE